MQTLMALVVLFAGLFSYVALGALAARVLKPDFETYEGIPAPIWIAFWPLIATGMACWRMFKVVAFGKLPTKETRAERKQKDVEEREREADRAYERATGSR